MKYKVVVVDADAQRVVAEVDDMWIACMIVDTYEKYPVYDDIFIAKEIE